MSTPLAQRLYELRRSSGISQEDLARKLGVSRQAVSKWECGESVPGTDNLIALARLYGVELGSLVGIDDDASGTEDESPAQATDALQAANSSRQASCPPAEDLAQPASASSPAQPTSAPSPSENEPESPHPFKRKLLLIACGIAATLLALALVWCAHENKPDYIIIEGTVIARDERHGDFVVDMGPTDSYESRYIVCSVDSNTMYTVSNEVDAPDAPDLPEPITGDVELQAGQHVWVSFDVRGGKPWPEAKNLAESVEVAEEGSD